MQTKNEITDWAATASQFPSTVYAGGKVKMVDGAAVVTCYAATLSGVSYHLGAIRGFYLRTRSDGSTETYALELKEALALDTLEKAEAAALRGHAALELYRRGAARLLEKPIRTARGRRPPIAPPISTGVVATCGECGLGLSSVMGYVCPRTNCPTGLGRTTTM